MTPAALLAGFCSLLAAVAVGRFALADEREVTETGTVSLVVGIAVLTASWAALSAGASGLALALALLGAGGVGVGFVVLVRNW